MDFVSTDNSSVNITLKRLPQQHPPAHPHNLLKKGNVRVEENLP
jgi:hypothetical protein